MPIKRKRTSIHHRQSSSRREPDPQEPRARTRGPSKQRSTRPLRHQLNVSMLVFPDSSDAWLPLWQSLTFCQTVPITEHPNPPPPPTHPPPGERPFDTAAYYSAPPGASETKQNLHQEFSNCRDSGVRIILPRRAQVTRNKAGTSPKTKTLLPGTIPSRMQCLKKKNLQWTISSKTQCLKTNKSHGPTQHA